MTADAPFSPTTEANLYEYLAGRALGLVTQALEAAGPMQRIRVTTLPDEVMERICAALQGNSR
jgi:hypothetical protein